MYSVVAKHLDSDWPRFQYSLKSHHAGVVTVSDGVSLDYTRLFCILSSENGRQRIQANPWGDGQTLGGMGKPVGGWANPWGDAHKKGGGPEVRTRKGVSQLPRFIVPSGSWAPTHLTGGGARGQTNSNVGSGHASATDDQTGPGVRP